MLRRWSFCHKQPSCWSFTSVPILKVVTAVPAPTSQSFTVLSPEAEISWVLSGLQLTWRTKRGERQRFTFFVLQRVMVFTGALKAAQTAHLCHTEKILAQMTLGKKNNNNTHSIDSSIVGFLSTQSTNFLTSSSITNKYLEMTPRICVSVCVIFRCISCVFGPKSTEPKYPADSLLTWPSALAVTNRLPSGEKRTQLTNWLCSF